MVLSPRYKLKDIKYIFLSTNEKDYEREKEQD